MALRQVPAELDGIGNTGECRDPARHGSVVGGAAEERRTVAYPKQYTRTKNEGSGNYVIVCDVTVVNWWMELLRCYRGHTILKI